MEEKEEDSDFKYELFFLHTWTQAALTSPSQKKYFFPTILNNFTKKLSSLTYSFCE